MSSPLDSSVAVAIKNNLKTRLPKFVQSIGSDRYLDLCNGLYQFSLQNQITTLNEFHANINCYINVINNSYTKESHKPIELLSVYCNALPTSGCDSSNQKLTGVLTTLMGNDADKRRLIEFCEMILIQADSPSITTITRDKKILWFINTLIDVINDSTDGSISIPKFQHAIPNIKDKCVITSNDSHCYKLSKRTINSIIGLFVFLLILIIFLLLSKK